MPFWTPRRKNRKYQRFTVAELLSRLTGRNANQIFADIEKHGDGHVIPLSMINALSDTDGTVKSQGIIRTASGSTTGTTGHTMTVGTDTEGTVIEALLIQCTWLCDATVANRGCAIALPTLGLTGVAGTNPKSLNKLGLISLQASEYGYFIAVTSGVGDLWTCDNGTTTSVANDLGLPQYLNEGAEIKALIDSNGQAGDKAGVDIIYRVVA